MLLVERLGIAPEWPVENSQSRLFVTRSGFLLWRAAEEELGGRKEGVKISTLSQRTRQRWGTPWLEKLGRRPRF